jgi:hypothetical protein
MTTTAFPGARVIGPQYYRTFGGYKIPFHPVGPWSFADTEAKSAYCSVYHSATGRVVRFDKIELVRLEKEPREVALIPPAEPEDTIYFAVATGAAPGEVSIGERLTYEDTEHREEFFAGHAGPTGKTGKVQRFRREIAFTDIYEYWPNGRMRRRIKNGAGKPPSEENYDRYGDRVAERIPFAWEAILRQGVQAMDQGDYPTARAKFEDAQKAAIKEESLYGEAAALNRLARVDLDEALQAATKQDCAAAERLKAAAREKSGRALPLWRVMNNPHEEMSAWNVFRAAENQTGTNAVGQHHPAEVAQPRY